MNFITRNAVQIAQQVTIQTAEGKIRADFVTLDKDGVLHIYVIKASQTAALTKNQKTAMAEIFLSGGTMVGKNASVFGENVQIPVQTIVELIRRRT